MAEERYKQPAGPAPRGTPPALPSWEHVHLISSSAKVEGRAGHPCPPGGSGGTPTAALHGCLVTSDYVNMGYRRQCYEIKQEKSSGNFK